MSFIMEEADIHSVDAAEPSGAKETDLELISEFVENAMKSQNDDEIPNQDQLMASATFMAPAIEIPYQNQFVDSTAEDRDIVSQAMLPKTT